MLSSVNWAGDKGGTATALGRQERVSGTSSRSGGGAGTGEGGEAVLSVVVVEVDGEGISGERRNQLPGRFAAVRSRWPARHPKLFFPLGMLANQRAPLAGPHQRRKRRPPVTPVELRRRRRRAAATKGPVQVCWGTSPAAISNQRQQSVRASLAPPSPPNCQACQGPPAD